jgi:hypothetical protein
LAEDVLAFTAQSGISIVSNAGGVLKLSGTATVAQYQAALRTVTYADTSNNPNTTLRTISFVVNDGAVSSNVANKNVAVVQIDQAPTVTVPIATQSLPQGGSIVLSTATGNAISFADIDANGGQELVSLSVASGSLTLAQTTGLSFTSGTGTGNASMAFKGTLANINAALNGLTYTAPSAAGSSSLSVTINDQGNSGLGGPLSASASVAISISAVAPVTSLTKSSPTFTQGGLPVVLDAGLTVGDPGNPNLASATVAIASGFVSGQDVLSFTTAPGISGGYSTASGALTFTGVASLATYQTLLESVTYKNTSNNPNTTARNISFVVNDGSTGSVPVFKSVSIIQVNQTPTLTVPATTTLNPLKVTQNNSVSFSGANLISVGDVDANSGTEQVTLLVSHGTLTLHSTTGLTFSINTGSNLQFKGTMANLNAALNGLLYSPNPGFANNTDTLQVTINDLGNTGTGGALSASSSVLMSVIASNAPAVLPATGTLNYTDSQGAMVLDPTIQLTDPVSGAQITSATVSITSGFISTEDTLSVPNVGNITSSFVVNGSVGQLILSGTDSLANYQAALDSVTYQDLAANPNTQPRTVTLTVTDSSANTSGAAIRTINVAHGNLAPLISGPSTLATGLNTPLVLSSATSNTFTVMDPDANGGVEQVTLAATNGVVTLGSTSGLTTVTGNSSGTVVFTGTIAALNTALGNVTFTPNSGFVGSATLQATIDDQGNSGAGGDLSALATANITVTQLSPFVIQGTVLMVNGTDNINDNFSLSFTSASSFNATLNGLTNSFTIPAITQVIFNGRNGTDSATIDASNFTSPATIITMPGSLVYKESTGFEIDATSSESVNVKAKASDTGELYSATGDIYTFTATPAFAKMVGSVRGLVSEIDGAGTNYGVAVNAADVANLYDATGTNWFVGTPNYSYLTNESGGSSFFNEAENFQTVTATAAAGTQDVAFLYDSGVQSTFTANQNLAGTTGASMVATGATPYNNQVSNFVNVLGFALNTNSVANLNDTTSSTENDLIGTPTYTTFSTTAFGVISSANPSGFDSQAIFFHHVVGIAANKADVAYLYGSAGGGDAFVGTGSHYANGASDGYGSYASLANSGAFLNETFNFASVLAVANGPNDTANLYDDIPGTFFVSNYFQSTMFAAMVGTGYDNGVLGFKNVAIAPIVGSTGSKDVASLTDSTGNDALFAQGDNLTLNYSTGNILTLSDIASITASSANGGTDTKSTRSYDLALSTPGNWVSG